MPCASPFRSAVVAIVASAVLPLPCAYAQAQAARQLPDEAAAEDYRRAAGVLEGGVLRIRLDAREAAWRPWGADGATLRTHVFAADGAAPRTPAPLVRVRAGTPVHITFTNALSEMLVIRGLRDRGGTGPAAAAPFLADSVTVPPGGRTEHRFTPVEPGTFLWFGRTLVPGERAPGPFPVRAADRSLWGVLIVDPADAEPDPRERVFLITHWADPAAPGTFLPATRMFVNGRSWPHTERLTYEQGDTVRWRVLNATGRPHPMHLHGFYFTVDARGDQRAERVYAPAERALGVTETLDTNGTMRVSWVAAEPGNWLFHCHFMRHMSWLQTSPPDAPAERHADHHAAGEALMGGLVLGITVNPRAGHAVQREPAHRRIDLHITRRDAVFGDAAGYAFITAADGGAPAPDSVHFPGSPLVLTRGEPTDIVVHNRTDVPLGVHWHGLELESRADGVPGWSGAPGSTVPAIATADSLTVRITPRRAGTFMYHVHSEPGHQLAQGLYGPFLVLEPGVEWDPARDLVFLLGSLGTGEDPPPAINGEHEHRPLVLTAGVEYRMRFMHISADDDKRVTLLSGDSTVTWRARARDGADLPPALVRETPADLRINVGETYDFMWTPQPGEYSLRVLTTFDPGVPAFRRDAPPPHTALVRLEVRP